MYFAYDYLCVLREKAQLEEEKRMGHPFGQGEVSLRATMYYFLFSCGVTLDTLPLVCYTRSGLPFKLPVVMARGSMLRHVPSCHCIRTRHLDQSINPSSSYVRHCYDHHYLLGLGGSSDI